jgi:endonuclease/exonuclease/phosphatase family metal-dependent hydrolase
MSLQDKLKKWSSNSLEFETNQEKVLTHKLGDELRDLCEFNSTKLLQKSSRYQALSQRITNITYGYEYACYAEPPEDVKDYYRAVLWNLDHGIHFKGILESIRNRAMVSDADIYFFPQSDIGMERSHNQNVVRNLALELGYNYFFATSYLNIPGSQKQAAYQNTLGIEGNAIMTKLPLSNLRIIPIRNQFDPLEGPDKKLGCQKVLLADVLVGLEKLTLVCINLPKFSSQRQRADQLKTIFKRIKEQERDLPILMAGDFESHTYNCRSQAKFNLSILNKMFRGYDYIAEEHHAFPEKHFDRKLFDLLSKNGFSYEDLNEMGKATYHTDLKDLFVSERRNGRFENLMQNLINKNSKSASLKTEWFSANKYVKPSLSHQSERPKVIVHLYHQGKVVSHHDPVLLDFELEQRD